MPRKLPITIITGYVGSGKTTLILNLLPQLRKTNPAYKLALIKNEIGDLNIDSQLASSNSVASRELLGACICCTNVGQISESLAELERDGPDRIVIETSGSAEPIKLVMEIKRLSDERAAAVREGAALPLYELDGVISVIDVMNWGGYASTSFTAKLQARQTDLIVLNKWEDAGEQACETCLDRLGDMDVETPHVKSDRGWINKDLLFGLDASGFDWDHEASKVPDHEDHEEHQDHVHHMEEMECLSVTLRAKGSSSEIDLQRLEKLLAAAPKDEIFRIKAILRSSSPPNGVQDGHSGTATRYILNWAFGRSSWTSTGEGPITEGDETTVLRMSIFTARYESNKWQKRIETGQYITLSSENASEQELVVKKVL